MSAPPDRQAHWGDGLNHFFLEHKVLQKWQKKPIKIKGKRKIIIERSKTRFGELKKQAQNVVEASKQKDIVYPDQRYYFTVTFSDSVVRWSFIQAALIGLKAHVVRIVDERTVKVAIERDDESYKDFILGLFKGYRFISRVSETPLTEIVEPDLERTLRENPDEPLHVTIELSDLSGLRDLQHFESSLKQYLQSENFGSIEASYRSKKTAVYDGNVKARAVEKIASSVETVRFVERTPQMVLISEPSYPIEDVGLTSVISLTDKSSDAAKQKADMPCVCAIDSGVNQSHVLLRDFIIDMFDMTNGDHGPCDDSDGHGSNVSGLIIRGGNLATHHSPIATVAMMKGFHSVKVPITDPLAMITRAVEVFGGRTKTFNLSFGSGGPDPIRSRAVDEMVYLMGINLISSAGNVDIPTILEHIRRGEQYPSYLSVHPIFFPGDADNTLTVGSYSPSASNWIPQNNPSPFTRTGVFRKRIKPDLLEDGGNLHQIGSPNVTDLQPKGAGVVTTGLGQDGTVETAGTSFSAPAVATLVAQIVSKYRDASPFLVKALILSSCNQLPIANQKTSELLQGYGIPNHQYAISAYKWRASYLLQGEFSGKDPNEIHGYRFRFPNKANRFTVTFVAGKPPGSEGSFSLALKKPAVQPQSRPQPSSWIGTRETRRNISTTWQEVHNIRNAGRGTWWFGVFPHFDKRPGADKSLKYGCVVTVESTDGLDVYADIARWIGLQKTDKAAITAKEMSLQTHVS